MGVMHEADDAYSIQRTSLCYWLDQLLIWISSKFSMFHRICLLFILLNLVGVELLSCILVTISCSSSGSNYFIVGQLGFHVLIK